MTTPEATGPEGRRLACHRCGSDDLRLYEATREEHIWLDGLMLVDGRLYPLGEAIHTPGDILVAETRITCGACGHQWRPRRWIDGAYQDYRELLDGVPS